MELAEANMIFGMALSDANMIFGMALSGFDGRKHGPVVGVVLAAQICFWRV